MYWLGSCPVETVHTYKGSPWTIFENLGVFIRVHLVFLELLAVYLHSTEYIPKPLFFSRTFFIMSSVPVSNDDSANSWVMYVGYFENLANKKILQELFYHL